MDAKNIQQHLYHVFESMTLGDITRDDCICVPHELLSDDDGVDMVSTFAEMGVLTGDSGVVVRMKDGSRFQINIVQSR